MHEKDADKKQKVPDMASASCASSSDKEEVVYRSVLKCFVNGKEEEVTFRTDLEVPRSVLERAKHKDSDTGYDLCMSTAAKYKGDIILDHCAKELGCAKSDLKCAQCKAAPATTTTHVPFGMWHDDPVIILDLGGTTVCGNLACSSQASNSFMDLMSHMGEFKKQVDEKMGSKYCKSCNKLETEDFPLKRCSRCQNAYFCNQECQRRAWKMHKPQCVPVAKAKSDA